MFTTGETVGLAKWIIDDTCLVYLSVVKLAMKFFGLKITYITIKGYEISQPMFDIF